MNRARVLYAIFLVVQGEFQQYRGHYLDYILLSEQCFLCGVLLAVGKNHMYICIVVGCIYGYLCGGICQGRGIVLL
jgi:hypothetical protein